MRSEYLVVSRLYGEQIELRLYWVENTLAFGLVGDPDHCSLSVDARPGLTFAVAASRECSFKDADEEWTALLANVLVPYHALACEVFSGYIERANGASADDESNQDNLASAAELLGVSTSELVEFLNTCYLFGIGSTTDLREVVYDWLVYQMRSFSRVLLYT
jgi:hypothetical protein